MYTTFIILVAWSASEAISATAPCRNDKRGRRQRQGYRCPMVGRYAPLGFQKSLKPLNTLYTLPLNLGNCVVRLLFSTNLCLSLSLSIHIYIYIYIHCKLFPGAWALLINVPGHQYNIYISGLLMYPGIIGLGHNIYIYIYMYMYMYRSLYICIYIYIYIHMYR